MRGLPDPVISKIQGHRTEMQRCSISLPVVPKPDNVAKVPKYQKFTSKKSSRTSDSACAGYAVSLVFCFNRGLVTTVVLLVHSREPGFKSFFLLAM
jgi:hypothetical protein